MRNVFLHVGKGGTALLIPDGWDVFIYRGFLYMFIDGVVTCVEAVDMDDDDD